MTIYIFKNNTTWGPYDIAQIQELLERGNIADTDLAAVAGRDQWTPLMNLVRIESPPPTSSLAAFTPTPLPPLTATTINPVTAPKLARPGICPFCGHKKIRIASSELQFQEGFHILKNRMCKVCGAVWVPSISRWQAVLASGCALAVFVPVAIALPLMWPYSIPLIYRRFVLEQNALSAAKILLFTICAPFVFVQSLKIIRRAISFVRQDQARQLTVVRTPVRNPADRCGIDP